jgi:hypothetical protein
MIQNSSLHLDGRVGVVIAFVGVRRGVLGQPRRAFPVSLVTGRRHGQVPGGEYLCAEAKCLTQYRIKYGSK